MNKINKLFPKNLSVFEFFSSLPNTMNFTIIFTSFKRNSLRKDDPLFLGANYICSCYRLIFCPSNKVKCKTLKTTNVQVGMIFNFTCQKLLQTVNLELI